MLLSSEKVACFSSRMVFFKAVFIFCLLQRDFVSSLVQCTTKHGVLGSCRPITDCLYDNDVGSLNDLTPCDKVGEVGIFCCIDSSSRNYSKLCEKAMNLRKDLNISSYNEESSTITVGQLPHMAAVYFHEKGFVGAGVLLNEKFVLTSAHTVYVRRSLPFVRLGKITLNDGYDVVELDMKVKQVIPHELFIPREKYYDVALLLLDKAVKFSSNVLPVCLHRAKADLSENDILHVSGFFDGLSSLMVQSKLRLVSNAKCQKFYDDKKYFVSLPNGIDDSLFCAYIDDETNCPIKDGPVYIHLNNNFFVFGFSNDISCLSNRPDIYTKISDVLEWIENIVV